mgnify:CR=1 FL=1
MGDFLIFVLHCVLFIGVVIATLFINQYSFTLAMSFDALYLISVKLFCKELEN